MNWRNRLHSKTRDPAFLWRMVLSILGVGVAAGYVASLLFGGVSSPEVVVPAEYDQFYDQFDRLASQGEWSQLVWTIPKIVFPQLCRAAGPLFLACWAGFLWLLFLLQVVGIRPLRNLRLMTILVAVGLGVLSIWPTLFFSYYQEYRWGVVASDGLSSGLRYFVIGVGLREEMAKLLVLLPLLFLLRKQDELLVLVTSASVGLGFAIAENSGYFLRSGGQDLLGRFLTANPAHMTLTGLIGLATFRGLSQPKDWGPHAVALFGVLVFVHGLYDAAIVLPALAEYSLVATLLFFAIVYQFFHELRALRPTLGEPISLTANFLGGLSLATSVTFIYLSVTSDWAIALKIMAPQVMSLSLMAYLFLREMPETLVSV